MSNRPYIGVVEQGRLRVLAAESGVEGTLSVTGSFERDPADRDTAATDLAVHEGLVVLIRGVDDGEWIYGAVVVEVATQLMTALAREVYEPGAGGRVAVPEG